MQLALFTDILDHLCMGIAHRIDPSFPSSHIISRSLHLLPIPLPPSAYIQLEEKAEDATKSAYVAQFGVLKEIGDNVVFHDRHVDERCKAIAQLRKTLDTYMAQAKSHDEKCACIKEKNKQVVIGGLAPLPPLHFAFTVAYLLGLCLVTFIQYCS
ncbi:hypothetical protein NMY22_g14633 [Coprinellus aureogranulatus]|nr:hypothetical protein NMY22_g14633 [Coprinellus aureogranulatus]